MRKLRHIFIVLSILSCRGLSAQEFDLYDFRYYKRFETAEELLAPEVKDTLLLPKFALNRHFTTNLLDYNLSMVRYTRRGLPFYRRKTTLNGVEIPFIGASSTRALRIKAGRTIDKTELYIDTLPDSRTSVGFSFSSRNMPYSLLFATSHKMQKGWSVAANISAQTGRDLHVEGLYGNSLEVNIAASKILSNKDILSFAILAKPSMRSGRTATTAEAFRLIGNRLYNPAWGYRNGKVCNSRVRREFTPTAFIGYSSQVGERTNLDLAVAATAGIKRFSSLDWFDTQTPAPDNYRYMPSYFEDEDDIFLAVEEAWLNNNTDYTQIDFDRLIATNILNGNKAIYAITDRVRRVVNVNFRGGFTTTLDKSTFSYGIDATVDNNRNYKQMRDLLKAKYLIDLDYFLLDDDTYGNSLQNNLDNPNRRIYEGDRYGYDYAMRHHSVNLFGVYTYTTDKLSIDAAARIGYCAISRKGFYRKELFSDNSFGRSRKIKFSPYSLRLSAEYLPADNHFIRGVVATIASPCEAEELFLQSQYNNRIIDNPEMRREHSVELQYMFQRPKLKLSTTLFFAADCNDTQVRQIYDDLSREYADIVTTNIDILRYGLEVETEYHFAEHFRATAAIVLGRYHYATNSLISIYTDTSNLLLAKDIKSATRGLSLGNAPQIAATASLSYYNRGWFTNINFNYAGLRYIEPSALMRTERVLSMAVSPEQRRDLLQQERLKDAFTIDLSLSKSLFLNRLSKRIYSTTAAPRFEDKYPYSRLVFRIGIRNLLGSSDIVYNGYESSRLQRYKLADSYIYSRQASRYLYAYPRTFYASVTFAF